MTYAEHQELAFAAPAEVRRVQGTLLREHLAHCAANSPYYREVLAEVGVEPETFVLEDLASLPLTGKEELGRRNDEFLAVPMREVVDVVLSSGTTGPPTRIAYSEADLERLAYNERQSFLSAGLTADDVVLLTCTMDRCFVAGLAYFLGVRAVGAAAIRSGHGTMDGHRALIRRMRPTVIVGVPSFLVKLGEHVAAAGLGPDALSVGRLLCIGEPVRDADLAPLPAARALRELWGADVHSTYASSETVTTFCECTARRGGHLLPELGIVEVVDEAGRPVAPGEMGEVVVTPLGVEGMPLIRFRTDDLSFLMTEPCSCGRTSPRLGPILARKKQMMKYKGTTLYPQSIASALARIPAIVEHFVEVRGGEALADRVTVHVAVSDGEWDAGRIAERLSAHLRVRPEVVVEPVSVVREQVFSPQYRKPMRFVDRRES